MKSFDTDMDVDISTAPVTACGAGCRDDLQGSTVLDTWSG